MNEKYWQKLLRGWRQQGRDGFSIPYIIGSQQYLPGDYLNQDIEELITDNVESNEETILLKYCFGIGDLILEMHETNDGISGHFLSFRSSPQSGLVILNFIDDLGNSIEELILILTERYQCCIDANEFSINEGERGNYSPDERAFIRDCFADYVSS